jgi:hypothetical protein
MKPAVVTENRTPTVMVLKLYCRYAGRGAVTPTLKRVSPPELGLHSETERLS